MSPYSSGASLSPYAKPSRQNGQAEKTIMTRDDIKWELEMKADRVLYRLSAEQIAYLGDAFPWAVTDDDLANDGLVDMVRRSALRLGHEAVRAAKGTDPFFPVAI